jgi:PAS domain S-box-containing protein
MHKFPITDYKRFEELPLDLLDKLKFSIYLIDFNWNFLFVNQFVHHSFGKRVENIIGKNLWDVFPELDGNPLYKMMKKNIENGIVVNQVTNSPVNGQRVNVVGYALEDCYFFSSSVVPDKQDLLQELRKQLGNRNRS